jgi:hypothetical protein
MYIFIWITRFIFIVPIIYLLYHLLKIILLVIIWLHYCSCIILFLIIRFNFIFTAFNFFYFRLFFIIYFIWIIFCSLNFIVSRLTSYVCRSFYHSIISKYSKLFWWSRRTKTYKTIKNTRYIIIWTDCLSSICITAKWCICWRFVTNFYNII